MKGALSIAFEECLLPLAFDAGRCLFYLTIISGVYVLIRGNASEAIKKIKMSTTGYVILRCVVAFVNLVDRIADGIKF